MPGMHAPSESVNQDPREGAPYHLRSLATGAVVAETPDQPLTAPGYAGDGSLLRTEYPTVQFQPDPLAEGLHRFASWLPLRRPLAGSGGPVSWKSRGLADALSMKNLYVSFSGWWPERGARIPTGTFKENEAYAVFGRLGEEAHNRMLVVASAGNTARAFLRVATENHLPLVVVVPEQNLPEIWTVAPRGGTTVVVAVRAGMDYTDAIELAALLSESPGFRPEGGARNVARRDGMGTTYLAGAEAMGRVPDHYIQAVGSGTGGIAAWEANLRLLADGRYGSTVTMLHLVQNAPFQVLADSWAARSRDLLIPDHETARQQTAEIVAKVLANRAPPWSMTGGLFDALTATNGKMYAVANNAAISAGQRFLALEGVDLSPAAMVAVAGLELALEQGTINRDDYVLLNITGGGYHRIRKELAVVPVTPDILAGRELFHPEAIATAVRRIQTIRGE